MARIHWLALSLVPGLGPKSIRRMCDCFGGPEQALGAAASQLEEVEGIGPERARLIAAELPKAMDRAEAELAALAKFGGSAVAVDEPEYPAMLKLIPDPPVVLEYKGDLQPRDLNGLAIVGSRRCGLYGKEQAERLAALLAGSGFTIVSGGARGVDAAAHRGALRVKNGRTIAVLGSGLDVPYPPEHAELFAEVARNGAVMSEMPLGTPPSRENFPRRNRIVSGLSRGVMVVECEENSGAMITARIACDDHNRPVLAVPGRVDNPMSEGPHLLIRQGAALVRRLEDILDGLGPMPAELREAPKPAVAPLLPGIVAEEAEKAQQPGPMLSDTQQRILETLGREALSVDRLIDLSGLDAQIVLQELTMLSIRGQVRREGGLYRRRREQKERV